MNIIDRAKQFAIEAHGDQKRKYTGEPYWHHLQSVAGIVHDYGGTQDMIAAAWLHDTLEDTGTFVEALIEEFSGHITRMVLMLTDGPYPTPKMNRAARKLFDCARLAKASDDVKTVKLADLMDNTESITAHDPKFARVYLREKALLLPALQGGNIMLWHDAAEQVRVCLDRLDATP